MFVSSYNLRCVCFVERLTGELEMLYDPQCSRLTVILPGC